MKIINLLAVLLLAGCSSLQKVEVPLAEPCTKLTLPSMPHLPIYDLTDKSAPDVVVKSYAASVDTLKNHIRLIEEQNS